MATETILKHFLRLFYYVNMSQVPRDGEMRDFGLSGT
jgi:hypothetical protein